MKMTCESQRSVKILVIILNMFLLVAGCALLALSAWVSADGGLYTEILGVENKIYFLNFYFFIFAGAVLSIISCIGIFGTVNESLYLLGVYFGIVLFTFILQTAGSFLVYLYFPQFGLNILNRMKEYQPYFTSNLTPHNLTDNWDYIQRTYECCGYKNYYDWEEFGPYPQPAVLRSRTSFEWVVIPDSCCVVKNDLVVNEKACVTAVSDFFTRGCEEKVISYVLITGGFSMAILIVETMAIFFSCILNALIRRSDGQKAKILNTNDLYAGI